MADDDQFDDRRGRDRSRSRDRGGRDDDRGHDNANNNSNANSGDGANNNLYVTSLSFQVLLCAPPKLKSNAIQHANNPRMSTPPIFFLLAQTTDESLRAAFEVFGPVDNASVVKEPVSNVSRYVTASLSATACCL